MGSALVIPNNQISLELFKSICDDYFHEEIFDSCKDRRDLISTEMLFEMIYFKENISGFEEVFHFFGSLSTFLS